MTRRALKSILYEPFGILVPFANVGFDSEKVLLDPLGSYMVSLLIIELRAHPCMIRTSVLRLRKSYSTSGPTVWILSKVPPPSR